MRSFIASSVLLALAALPTALAAPVGAPPASGDRRGGSPIQPPFPFKLTGCPITSAPGFPADQTNLRVTDGLKPVFVALGQGVQNYTCSDAGKFTSAGAVATLYDVSCIPAATVKTLPAKAAKVAERPAALAFITKLLGKSPLHVADHYFIPAASGTGISPKFDFAVSQKKSGVAAPYVTAAKAGNIASPGGAVNVDWLALNGIDGAIAKQVFRVNTALGQPAASCTAGQTASIPYAANYWFYA